MFDLPDAILNDLDLRHDRLKNICRENSIDAILLTSVVNVYYTAGQIFDGFIYIPVNGEAFSFVKRPAGLKGDNVYYVRKPEQIPDILKQNGVSMPERIYIENDEISASENERLSCIFQNCEVYKGNNILRIARSIKTPYELAQHIETGKKHSETYENIKSLFTEGMTDLDLQAEIEYNMRKNGHLGLFRTFGKLEAYMGTVLSGENALEPSPYDFSVGGKGLHISHPIGANGTMLEEGKSVLVDIIGNYNGYITDMSRTFSVGKLPDEAYKMHDVSLEILDALVNIAKPGTPCSDLYNLAIEIAAKHQLSDNFMGYFQQAKFVGHSIGLQVNEAPVLTGRDNTLLQENMVIAIEPKFFVPNVGCVGVENSYIIRAGGPEKITHCNEDILNIAI